MQKYNKMCICKEIYRFLASGMEVLGKFSTLLKYYDGKYFLLIEIAK